METETRVNRVNISWKHTLEVGHPSLLRPTHIRFSILGQYCQYVLLNPRFNRINSAIIKDPCRTIQMNRVIFIAAYNVHADVRNSPWKSVNLRTQINFLKYYASTCVLWKSNLLLCGFYKPSYKNYISVGHNSHK